MRVCAFLLTVSFASLGTAAAQSLADVARQENNRRQGVQDGGKTYTNQDLKPVRQAPEPADQTGPAPAADPSGANASPADADAKSASASAADQNNGAQADRADASDKDRDKDKGDSDEKDQAHWSKRMAELRERLQRDQTYLDALQSRIDALTRDFVDRDDPAQRNQIAADRQRAVDELDRLRKAVEADRRAIPELEEEARRAGVPAGWLR
jgi:hypothetical protein